MYTGSCTEQTQASGLGDETKEDQDEETKLRCSFGGTRKQSSGGVMARVLWSC